MSLVSNRNLLLKQINVTFEESTTRFENIFSSKDFVGCQNKESFPKGSKTYQNIALIVVLAQRIGTGSGAFKLVKK